jgi:putative hemolysin
MIAGVSDIVGAVGVPSLVIASGDAEKRAALSALYHRIRWDERWGWIARSDSYWGIALLLGAAFGPSLRGAGRDLLELREKIKKSADLANAPAQVKGDVALVKSDPSALANEPDFCTVSG